MLFRLCELVFFDAENSVFQWDLRNGGLPHFRGPWERDSREKSFRESANAFDLPGSEAVYVAVLGRSNAIFLRLTYLPCLTYLSQPTSGVAFPRTAEMKQTPVSRIPLENCVVLGQHRWVSGAV